MNSPGETGRLKSGKVMKKMAQTLLATRQLTKRYSSATVVDQVSLTLRQGQIYGLVGQNGAGKTTLLRMVTGQTFPTSGDLELFGETSPQGIDRMRANLGGIVESPSFYPFFNARENLEYYRRQRGIAGKGCIDDALRQVELCDTGKKKFKDFSLGMKQRLGLALALMSHPALLLLDEPINGLDPMGIAHFRTLLQKLCEENGVTVLISSHILSELESLATCYGFIHQGRLMEQISEKVLRERCRECLELTVDNAEKAAVAIERELGCTNYEILPGGTMQLYDYLDAPAKVTHVLAANGVEISGVFNRGSNLEEYFLSLIGEGARKDA